ncbi:MAG: hypothetical protein GY868_09065, partial [Deltaproteobacteria bacterium]|nr:hypothetical protein [Deltaproteobacteria bacterium]
MACCDSYPAINADGTKVAVRNLFFEYDGGAWQTPVTIAASGNRPSINADGTKIALQLGGEIVCIVNDGAWQAPVIVSTLPDLSPPAGVTATDGTHSDKVAVTWDSVSGASHYRVYRNMSDSSASAAALSGWQTDTLYDDTTAAAMVNYYYWVKAAVDGSGAYASAFSAWDS